MYEESSYHQMSFFIANYRFGPLLATGHVLKDGGFSSIPSTYDQHTKPIAYSTDVFGWNVHVGEIYKAEESRWRWPADGGSSPRGCLQNWVGGSTSDDISELYHFGQIYFGMPSLSSLRQGTAKCAASLITYRQEVRHPNAFLFGYWIDVLLCCRFFERSHDNPSYTVVLTRISCALCLTLLLCTPFMKVFFDGVLPDDSQPYFYCLIALRIFTSWFTCLASISIITPPASHIRNLIHDHCSW